MRPPLYSPIGRIGVRPDQPDAMAAPRPRGSRRPHSDLKVAQVRRLIEDTPLTYGEIARRTGVGRASICRWTRDHGWRRPPFAPRANDLMPTPRASAQLRRRTLAKRLDALAERHIRELEEAACVDQQKLAEALELLKMARLAARPRHGRRRRKSASPFVPAPGSAQRAARVQAAGTQGPQTHEQVEPDRPTRPIMQLCLGDVNLHRASREAVEDCLEHREPPREEPGRRRPRRPSKRDEHHMWMLEKERP
jgi:hypothetical protein